MPNSYSQVYLQIVFGTYRREKTISKNLKDELYKYMTGILRNMNQKVITINGTQDHIHILINYNVKVNFIDLVKELKRCSSKFVNERHLIQGHFQWQEGYGLFSYHHSQLPSIIKYIENQEVHHKLKTFAEEYMEFLKEFNVDYDDKYLFND